jgi:hypothetical protein
MRQTSAHSCSNIVADFCCVLFFDIFMIFCSSYQTTALHYAASWLHTAACQLLISAEADVNATDECAFMFKYCYCIFVVFCFPHYYLIFCSSDQCTALHRAAYNGHTAACQLLISAEADMNAKEQCAFMFELFHRFYGVVFFS